MATEHDFAALRAQRNADLETEMRRLASTTGIPFERLMATVDPNACYCACAVGGPCEHTWTGWVCGSTPDGATWESTACGRCGTTAMSHDLRNAP